MFHRSTHVIAVIGGAFFLVSFIACALFMYSVSKQKAQLVEGAMERAQIQSHQNSLKSLVRTLDETKAERASLISRILKDEDVVTFLALIEMLGKEQGVALTTDSLTVQPFDAAFETLVINISVRGSYTSIMQMLKLMELLPYQSSVSRVDINRQLGNEWSSTFELKVTKYVKHEI